LTGSIGEDLFKCFVATGGWFPGGGFEGSVEESDVEGFVDRGSGSGGWIDGCH